MNQEAEVYLRIVGGALWFLLSHGSQSQRLMYVLINVCWVIVLLLYFLQETSQQQVWVLGLSPNTGLSMSVE